MSAAALTNTLAQPQGDPQIVFDYLNMINQLQEILKVAICSRCKIEVFYQVPSLPSLHRLRMLLTSLPAWCSIPCQKTSVIQPGTWPDSFFYVPVSSSFHFLHKRMKINQKRNANQKRSLMPCLGQSLFMVLDILHRCCCLCVFSLVSIDIFNSCFSYPFRGSLKTFVHTVHLLQKQTDLGSLPVADVLYRFVVTFLVVALLPQLWVCVSVLTDACL